MTFKIDENLPKDAAELLRSRGFDAETVREESLAGAGDDVIADTIQRENRVLITLDLDFSDIRTYPPEHYSGIVVLRSKITVRTKRSGLSSPIEFAIDDQARSVVARRSALKLRRDE